MRDTNCSTMSPSVLTLVNTVHQYVDMDIWFDITLLWIDESFRDDNRCLAKVSFLQHAGSEWRELE